MNTKILEKIYQDIGLANPKGSLYKEKIKKANQVIAYTLLIESALKKMSTKKCLVLLDCGCGKSYLSFVLYKYFREILNRKIHIIGLDNNPELIDLCNDTKNKLNFEDMEFHFGDIITSSFDRDIDITYSLHACDTATDQTIAKGVLEKSKFIFSVSCCQHTTRNSYKCSSLKAISRFQNYKERIVDMVGDSMRGLLLESLGYRVDLFEFVSASETPKNIMLRARQNSAKKSKKETALAEYEKLAELFNMRPKLETYFHENSILPNYKTS